MPKKVGLLRNDKSPHPKETKGYKKADINETIAQEAAPIYVSHQLRAVNALATAHPPAQNNTPIAIVAIMKNSVQKPESQLTPLEKMDLVRLGISKKNLELLKDKAKLDYDKLAVVLAVTRATLINKKGAEKFNAHLSERIVGLADIYSYGYEVFEDENRFNKWMFKPNHALGGQLPFDLLDNQFGREEVRNIIGRIDYGVYS